VGVEASATDPTTRSSVGRKAGYIGGNSSSLGFNRSTPFILGLRVRKIWWNKDSVRRTSDKVAGATLDSNMLAKEKVLGGLEYKDNATTEGKEVDIMEEMLGIDPLV